MSRRKTDMSSSEHIQAFIHAHAVVDAAGDAGNQFGGSFVQIESEGIPDGSGKTGHGFQRQVNGGDLLPDPVVFRQYLL